MYDVNLKTLSDRELTDLHSKLQSEIARLNNKQMAIKIMINSVYGSMGSPYFRYYDLRMAEGITTSGQLAIRWVSQDVNKSLNKVLGTNNVDYVIYNDTDSVVGDTMVYVNGKQQTIESLYEQYNTYAKRDDTRKNYVKPVGNATTVSVNTTTGELEEKSIVYVMKHRVKKRMFKIKSSSGKEVIVTQDHSIIVVRDGKIIDVSPMQLLESDRIINITTQTK